MNEKENALAVFIDFENLALGFKHKKEKRFDIQKVLERLVEKGEDHREEGLCGLGRVCRL